MDTRGMTSRGGGSVRTIFVLILSASVLVLGYRYSTLRTKYEEKNMILIERDYEVKEKQEEASSVQRQLVESVDAKKQCDATLEKERKDSKERVGILEEQVRNKDGKLKELEGKGKDLQSRVDACNKDKDIQINNVRKEADELKKGKDELQRQLDETKKQLDEAKKIQAPVKQQQPPAVGGGAGAAGQNPEEKDAKNIQIVNPKLIIKDVIEQQQKLDSSKAISNGDKLNPDKVNEKKITYDAGKGRRESEESKTGPETVPGREEKIEPNDNHVKEIENDVGSHQKNDVSETDRSAGEEGKGGNVAEEDKGKETDEAK